MLLGRGRGSRGSNRHAQVYLHTGSGLSFIHVLLFPVSNLQRLDKRHQWLLHRSLQPPTCSPPVGTEGTGRGRGPLGELLTAVPNPQRAKSGITLLTSIQRAHERLQVLMLDSVCVRHSTKEKFHCAIYVYENVCVFLFNSPLPLSYRCAAAVGRKAQCIRKGTCSCNCCRNKNRLE